MLIIEEPKLIKKEDLYYIECYIHEDKLVKKIFWGGVKKEYSKYLLTERSDAFLVGLLSYAMRGKHDIQCEAPVSEELLYNIQEILIPLLVKYGKNLYLSKITAKTESNPLENAGMIGTSASCGVDSFNTIKNQYKSDYQSMNLSHLCLNDVGAFNDCYGSIENRQTVKEERYEKAIELANELELPIVLTDSNFAQEFPQNHYLTHTYSSVFSILNMRKFWRIYFYSSSQDFGHFQLQNNDVRAPGYYELLSLNCFSTDGLRIYSEGAEFNRLEKMSNISEFPSARKYLHVCMNQKENCNVCQKCRRTLLCLDVIDKLNNFSNVFDVEYYKKHRIEYVEWLLGRFAERPEEIGYLYEEFRDTPEMHHLMKECKEIQHILNTKKIILYGCGDLGRQIQEKYSDSVQIKIDNIIKGDDIISFEDFCCKYTFDDIKDYVCIITSFSKQKILKEQIKERYPDLVILKLHMVKMVMDS